MDCPNKQKNSEDCGCTYVPCSRKGVCCECLRYHIVLGQLPGCVFPRQAESSYDRSIDNFIVTRKIKKHD